jgi:hypothetical protein
MGRRRLALITALALAGTTAAVVTAAVLRTQDSSGVSRVEVRFARAWESSCDFDDCGVATHPIQYKTPSDQPFVDVSFTVTLDYRTSRSTTASAGLALDDGTPPYSKVRPSFALGTSRRLTSTTLTWIRRDVPAAGREYTFWLGIAPRSHTSDEKFFVRGRRMTVVIESWTAGD